MPIGPSAIQVSVRVRPLTSKESNGQIIVELADSNQFNLYNPKLEKAQSTIIDNRDRYKQFTFDHCYLSINPLDPNYSNQQTIFNDIGVDVLKSFVDGYNTCILCYGQTGTGKTFTMMGNPSVGDEMGLTPRICEDLFKFIDTAPSLIESSTTICYKAYISYLEIYNEKLRDLFDFDPQTMANTVYQAPHSYMKNNNNPPTHPPSLKNLKIREHPNKGIYVQNLNQFAVSDLKTAMKYLIKGNQSRSTASTHVHDKSSRSHAIFTITFVQAKVENEIPVEIMSKLHLVDLAGSERAANDLNYNKKQLKEGSNINKSLVSLGNVISILAENTKRIHVNNSSSNLSLSNHSVSNGDMHCGRLKNSLSINNLNMHDSMNTSQATGIGSGNGESRIMFVPYRDSLLTYLLKDSLGGNSRTHMIANISPASCCYHETLNTLLFAQRAKKVVNKPRINEDPKTSLIKELKQEIFKLRELVAKSNINLFSIQSNDNQLESMLEKNELRAEELTLNWMDKWNKLTSSNSSNSPNSPAQLVRHKPHPSGSFMVQPDLPYLVSLNSDVLSSDIMIYGIKQGTTVLGNDLTSAEIVIKDDQLLESHCMMQNLNGVVTLSPIDDSICYVNNIEVREPTKLCQGDIIIIGKSVLRFNHPEEAARLREINQKTEDENFKIKSQSLPSLARLNLITNDSQIIMNKFIQQAKQSEECESNMSGSSSFMSDEHHQLHHHHHHNSNSPNKRIIPLLIAANSVTPTSHQSNKTCSDTASSASSNQVDIITISPSTSNKSSSRSSEKPPELVKFEEPLQLPSSNLARYDSSIPVRSILNDVVSLKMASGSSNEKSKLLNKKFRFEQFLSKKDYDRKLAEFNHQIKSRTSFDSDDSSSQFDYDSYFFINEISNANIVDYIRHFRVRSRPGQLKHRFNLELEFFTNLKNLRLAYNNGTSESLTFLPTLIEISHQNESGGGGRGGVDTDQKCVLCVLDLLGPSEPHKHDFNSSYDSKVKSDDKLDKLVVKNCQTNPVVEVENSDSVSKLINLNSKIKLNASLTDISSLDGSINHNDNLRRAKKIRSSVSSNSVFPSTQLTLKSKISSTPLIQIKPADANVSADAQMVSKKLTSSSSLFSYAASSSLSSLAANESAKKPSIKLKSSLAVKPKYLSQSDMDLASRSGESRPRSADSSYSAATTSYRLKTKDSDDDRLNKQTTNLFKGSMNRIDNTHATFLNCLRDWNDPYLNGGNVANSSSSNHIAEGASMVGKQRYPGCLRCESCACRLSHDLSFGNKSSLNRCKSSVNISVNSATRAKLVTGSAASSASKSNLLDVRNRYSRKSVFNVNESTVNKRVKRTVLNSNNNTTDHTSYNTNSDDGGNCFNSSKLSTNSYYSSEKDSIECLVTRENQLIKNRDEMERNLDRKPASTSRDKKSISRIPGPIGKKSASLSSSARANNTTRATVSSAAKRTSSSSKSVSNEIKSKQIRSSVGVGKKPVNQLLVASKYKQAVVSSKNLKNSTTTSSQSSINLSKHDSGISNNNKKSTTSDSVVTMPNDATSNLSQRDIENRVGRNAKEEACLDNTRSLLSTTTDDSIEHDPVYDDSLRDESFDSDSLMVDSEENFKNKTHDDKIEDEQDAAAIEPTTTSIIDEDAYLQAPITPTSTNKDQDESGNLFLIATPCQSDSGESKRDSKNLTSDSATEERNLQSVGPVATKTEIVNTNSSYDSWPKQRVIKIARKKRPIKPNKLTSSQSAYLSNSSSNEHNEFDQDEEEDYDEEEIRNREEISGDTYFRDSYGRSYSESHLSTTVANHQVHHQLQFYNQTQHFHQMSSNSPPQQRSNTTAHYNYPVDVEDNDENVASMSENNIYDLYKVVLEPNGGQMTTTSQPSVAAAQEAANNTTIDEIQATDLINIDEQLANDEHNISRNQAGHDVDEYDLDNLMISTNNLPSQLVHTSSPNNDFKSGHQLVDPIVNSQQVEETVSSSQKNLQPLAANILVIENYVDTRIVRTTTTTVTKISDESEYVKPVDENQTETEADQLIDSSMEPLAGHLEDEFDQKASKKFNLLDENVFIETISENTTINRGENESNMISDEIFDDLEAKSRIMSNITDDEMAESGSRKYKADSESDSPVLKKKKSQNDDEHIEQEWFVSSQPFDTSKIDKYASDDGDEFFLAVTTMSNQQLASTRPITNSCPDISIIISDKDVDKRKIYDQRKLVALEMKSKSVRHYKSVNDMYELDYTKLFSNSVESSNKPGDVEHSNQISASLDHDDSQDGDYMDYVRRHVQGLFGNFSPVLTKSKSNEEISKLVIMSDLQESKLESGVAENEQSVLADQPVAMNQATPITATSPHALPKSVSFDLKMLEKSRDQDQDDGMDFSKFGFGVRTASTDDSSHSSSIVNEQKPMNDAFELITFDQNLSTIEEPPMNNELMSSGLTDPDAGVNTTQATKTASSTTSSASSVTKSPEPSFHEHLVDEQVDDGFNKSSDDFKQEIIKANQPIESSTINSIDEKLDESEDAQVLPKEEDSVSDAGSRSSSSSDWIKYRDAIIEYQKIADTSDENIEKDVAVEEEQNEPLPELEHTEIEPEVSSTANDSVFEEKSPANELEEEEQPVARGQDLLENNDQKANLNGFSFAQKLNEQHVTTNSFLDGSNTSQISPSSNSDLNDEKESELKRLDENQLENSQDGQSSPGSTGSLDSSFNQFIQPIDQTKSIQPRLVNLQPPALLITMADEVVDESEPVETTIEHHVASVEPENYELNDAISFLTHQEETTILQPDEMGVFDQSLMEKFEPTIFEVEQTLFFNDKYSNEPAVSSVATITTTPDHEPVTNKASEQSLPEILTYQPGDDDASLDSTNLNQVIDYLIKHHNTQADKLEEYATNETPVVVKEDEVETKTSIPPPPVKFQDDELDSPIFSNWHNQTPTSSTFKFDSEATRSSNLSSSNFENNDKDVDESNFGNEDNKHPTKNITAGKLPPITAENEEEDMYIECKVDYELKGKNRSKKYAMDDEEADLNSSSSDNSISSSQDNSNAMDMVTTSFKSENFRAKATLTKSKYEEPIKAPFIEVKIDDDENESNTIQREIVDFTFIQPESILSDVGFQQQPDQSMDNDDILDFTDLSKEIDEESTNWLQEDDEMDANLWLQGNMNAPGLPALTPHGVILPAPARQLDKIEEASNEDSYSYSSSNNSDDEYSESELLNRNVHDDEIKVTCEYDQQGSSSAEKLRSKQCDLDSLLGAENVKEEVDEDVNELSNQLASEKIVDQEPEKIIATQVEVQAVPDLNRSVRDEDELLVETAYAAVTNNEESLGQFWPIDTSEQMSGSFQDVVVAYEQQAVDEQPPQEFLVQNKNFNAEIDPTSFKRLIIDDQVLEEELNFMKPPITNEATRSNTQHQNTELTENDASDFEEESEQQHISRRSKTDLYNVFEDENDEFSSPKDPMQPIQKAESDFDISKLKLNMDDEANNVKSSNDKRLEQILSDIHREMNVVSTGNQTESFCEVIQPKSDKCDQVIPRELPGYSMKDSHTQMTPPLERKFSHFEEKKKLANASTETDDAELLAPSEWAILNEEMQLRKKLIEKEQLLRSASIATQTSCDDTPTMQHTTMIKVNVDNIYDDKKDEKTEMIETKIAINPLNTSRQSLSKPPPGLIDWLSLNLDRSKTWVEMTEAKLNCMIDETDAVLKNMCLDSSVSDEEDKMANRKSEDTKRVSIKSNTSSSPSSSSSASPPESSAMKKSIPSNLNKTTSNMSLNKSSLMASPEQNHNMLNSTTLPMAQQQQIEELNRRHMQLLSESSILNASITKEKERQEKLREAKRRELSEKRRAAIEAFKREREIVMKDTSMNSKTNSSRLQVDTDVGSRGEILTGRPMHQNGDYSHTSLVIDDLLILDNDFDDIMIRKQVMPSRMAGESGKMKCRNVIIGNSSTPGSSTIINIIPPAINNTPNGKPVTMTALTTTTTTMTTTKTTTQLEAAAADLLNNYNNSSYILPIRQSRSSTHHVSSTPRRDEDIKRAASDTRTLLIPVNNMSSPVFKTSNTNINLMSGGSTNRSIIDESRMLLKEYEQLRSDSVSEIQRAQDSLNASLIWLENQKLNEDKNRSSVVQSLKSDAKAVETAECECSSPLKPTKQEQTPLIPIIRHMPHDIEKLVSYMAAGKKGTIMSSPTDSLGHTSRHPRPTLRPPAINLKAQPLAAEHKKQISPQCSIDTPASTSAISINHNSSLYTSRLVDEQRQADANTTHRQRITSTLDTLRSQNLHHQQASSYQSALKSTATFTTLQPHQQQQQRPPFIKIISQNRLSPQVSPLVSPLSRARPDSAAAAAQQSVPRASRSLTKHQVLLATQNTPLTPRPTNTTSTTKSTKTMTTNMNSPSASFSTFVAGCNICSSVVPANTNNNNNNSTRDSTSSNDTIKLLNQNFSPNNSSTFKKSKDESKLTKILKRMSQSNPLLLGNKNQQQSSSTTDSDQVSYQVSQVFNEESFTKFVNNIPVYV